jgi:hypothetical protein
MALKQLADAANAVAIASQDADLQKVLQSYQSANLSTRKSFVKNALSLLSSSED